MQTPSNKKQSKIQSNISKEGLVAFIFLENDKNIRKFTVEMNNKDYEFKPLKHLNAGPHDTNTKKQIWTNIGQNLSNF